MQWLRRISRSASSRRLYCFLFLLQLLVIVTAAPRNSETGVSGATEQQVSGGNVAAAADVEELLTQRLSSMSLLVSPTMNMKEEEAQTSRTISGRKGDTNSIQEKLKELDLPVNWKVEAVGNLSEKELDRQLARFQKRRDMVNSILSLIMEGKLGEWINKLLENKSTRRNMQGRRDLDVLSFNIQDDAGEEVFSKNEDMFSSGRRKRFLKKVNTDEQSRLKNTATSDQNRIRQKRHSWHFMGENFWDAAPQSDLVYSGVPTIVVHWPPPSLTSALPPEFARALLNHRAKKPHTKKKCINIRFQDEQWNPRASTNGHWPTPNDVDDWYSDPYPPMDYISESELISDEKDIIKDYYSEDNSFIEDYSVEGKGIIKDYYDEVKDYYDDIKDSNSKITDINTKITDSNTKIKDKIPDDKDEDKKLTEERLRTGGLREMLQYKKNDDLKKNQPLEHLKSHQNPPWPNKDIIGIPRAINHRSKNRKTKNRE